MCSFVVWTTMMCHLSIGTSACRPCKVTPECPTLLILRLLESPLRWTVAEPLVTSFMQPTTETGKASETRDSPWVTPGRKASPAAGHSYGLCWGLGGAEAWDAPMGTGSSEARATGGSPMGEGPGPSSSSAAGGSAFAEEPDAAVGTPTFNLDDLRRVIQEQELAEQTESEGRRIPKKEGVLEVDANISLERECILEQEALIQKMNANPCFIYEQGVTRLKWPSGAYVVSEHGDGRVKTTSWVEVPDKLRRSLVDFGPETWICHPFSGFSVYFFLKAHELGKWQGNLLMEMEKERVYTRLDDQGNPRAGYKSGFGDIPDLLYTNQSLIDAEFRDEDFITFRKPTPKDKRAKKPSPTNMSDEDYATAMEDHRFYPARARCLPGV